MVLVVKTMLLDKDILDEKNKILHKPSKDVTFPMDEKDIKMIDDMIEHFREYFNIT